MSVQKIHLPDIGDFSDVEIIEVLVTVGDIVSAEDSLITLESDKASMEIPSPCSGTVKALHVKLGDKVSKDDLIVSLETTESKQEPEPAEPSPNKIHTDEPKKTVATPPIPTEHTESPLPVDADLTVLNNQQHYGAQFHASPKIRRKATELGVNLSLVKGSGPNNRITRDDVVAYIKERMSGAVQPVSSNGIPTIPNVDFSEFGAVEPVALSRIKKLSGKHLSACWLNIPHVSQFNDADITDLEAFRQSLKQKAERAGVKITPLTFIIKAVIAALKDHPAFNASLDGEQLILKQYFHIGIAVDTPNGLVVPVIRNADQKGVFELALEMAKLSEQARAGKLSPDDLKGASFSISSLGGIGGTYFSPIINAPEVAILGVGRSSIQPVWSGEAFEPKLMLPFAISYDHRVIDGAQGARFVVTLSEYLSDIRTLIL